LALMDSALDKVGTGAGNVGRGTGSKGGEVDSTHSSPSSSVCHAGVMTARLRDCETLSVAVAVGE
jgi:hypothetical protein